MRGNTFVDLVRHVRVGHARHRLRPFERRPLAIAEKRRLAPGVERIDTLLRFSGEPRVLEDARTAQDVTAGST